MNIKPALLFALFAFAAFPAHADYAIAYHGKLVATGTAPISAKIPMQMSFRLFGSAEPDGSAPLWGRSLSVRFDDEGLFYVELRDSSGAALSGARHAALADAVAEGGTNVWISVTPAGCGELLPRKRLGAVHRAERAATAVRTAVAAAPTVESRGEIAVGELVVRGNFTAEKIVPSSGFTVSNTVTAGSGVSLGSPGGSVLFAPSFDWWTTLVWPEPYPAATSGTVASDTLATCADASLGVYTLPLRQGGSSWPVGYFRVSGFIAGE